MASLEQFEHELRSIGYGIAPNGASYRAIPWGPRNAPAMERTKDGQRDNVVGFDSWQFGTEEEAINWALQDGRRAYAPGTPLSQRQVLA